MIERAKQKKSAPIAKRISGDGAFCLFNSFIFSEIYLAGCALIGGAAGLPKKRECSERFFGTASVATCIYIRAHPALICLKKQFFVECFLA